MKVLSIIHDSIVDGEGLRTVIFFAGCPHHCQGCHNPESWNFENGQEYSVEQLVSEVISNPINEVTFSGGDPFYQAKEIIILAKKLKSLGKNIWAYTGYTLEELLFRNDEHELALLREIDVLVDGPFIQSQRNLSLPFRGSNNQRIIKLT
ncbi:MAG: anaerobic ribonucleoside-triphosphate reductase activating protein [Anaerobacillus sp.]|uniref:anaerobic ribonucleoside-triphosphate reductase activating protein n=1 Tax=Anaerobacillus sp. TaxID=1872506 RepID=UPI0039199C28